MYRRFTITGMSRQFIQFIQSGILLMLLTLISMFTSHNPYLSVMQAGILMIIFAIESIDDEYENRRLIIQFVFSAFFVLLSDNVFSYIIFFLCKKSLVKTLNIFYPSAMFVLLQVFIRDMIMAEIIVYSIALICISCLICLIQKLSAGYMEEKDKVIRMVSVTAVRELYEKKINHQLVIKNYLAERNLRLEERENISRSIHNSVGHSITAAIMTLEAADTLLDVKPERAREKLNTANERIKESLSSIRHAVRVLDSDKKSVAMEDFIREIQAVTDSFMADTNIKIRGDYDNTDKEIKIPQEYGEFLTGAVLEFLTNGVRHGGADVFTVALTTDSRHIKISVSDNGKSNFSGENQKILIENGFGLKKITAYAEKCGGRTEFSRSKGFRAVVILPVMEEDNE